MGTPKFCIPILDSIFNSKHKILHVYTQSPKKKNRGQKENHTPVHDYAIEKKNKNKISKINLILMRNKFHKRK